MPQLDIGLSPANDARRAVILSLPVQIEADLLPRDVTDAIRGLWRNPGVQSAVRRAREGEQEHVAGELVGAPVLDRGVHRETAHLEP